MRGLTQLTPMKIAAALVVIVAVAGAVVTITNPSAEPFDRYVTHITLLGSAFGLGIGVTRISNKENEDD